MEPTAHISPELMVENHDKNAKRASIVYKQQEWTSVLHYINN